MTEDDAQDWVRQRYGDNAYRQVAAFVGLVTKEATQQNLVSASTIDHIWSRHVVDSAQLISFADHMAADGKWIDIGTGAGFPGIIVALLTGRPMILVEPRRRRVEFLAAAIERLDLGTTTTVETAKIQNVASLATIISARAVGQTAALFDAAIHCASLETLWVLPKGQGARDEVVRAKEKWHGVFHVEHSITDPNSLIILATGVSRR